MSATLRVAPAGERPGRRAAPTCARCAGEEPEEEEAGEAGLGAFHPISSKQELLDAIHGSNTVPTFILVHATWCPACSEFKRQANRALSEKSPEALSRVALYAIDDDLLSYPDDEQSRGEAAMPAHYVFEHLQVPPDNRRPVAVTRVPAGKERVLAARVVGVSDALAALRGMLASSSASSEEAGRQGEEVIAAL